MNVQEAYNVLKKKTDKIAVSCIETEEFFGFAMVEEKYKKEPFGGGYITVNKISLEIGAFTPAQDIQLFIKSKQIDVNELE